MNWKHTGKTVLVLTAIVIIISLAAPHNGVPKTAPASTETGLRVIQLAGQELRVSVVATPEDRAKGLGGRTGLASDEGMLFAFESDAKYRFWMKDMLFTIDIVWISDTGEVVDIRKNVSPATYPEVFTPIAPARYVLELPAGFAEAYSVRTGDIVGL